MTNEPPTIHFPTAEEDKQALDMFFVCQKKMTTERRHAAVLGMTALDNLIDVMNHQTGQGYKLRALLFSLYNGKPTRLVEVLNLDWSLRQDFAAVLLGFGFEQGGTSFFYKEMKEAISRKGLWKWFIEQGEVNS